jgi:hypothetical protein
MKTITPLTAGSNPSKAILKNMVDQLVKSSLPAAERNGSRIVNEVSEKLSINTDENAVTSIINGLIHAMISNTKDSCIRIFAKEIYESMIEISVKDNNCCHTYAVACNLQEMVPQAQKIGGSLNITNQRQSITTISFRFPVVRQEHASAAAWKDDYYDEKESFDA